MVKETKKQSTFDRTNQYEKDYVKGGKSMNDPRFGSVMLYNNLQHNMPRVMSKTNTANTEQAAHSQMNTLKRRMELNHPHLQRMLDWSSQKKSGLCSTSYKAVGYYEYPDNDLKSLVKERRVATADFTHEDLTNMTYQLLDAVCWLNKNGANFDDIRPAYVSMSHHNNYWYLADRLNNAARGYEAQTLHYTHNDDLYMSPEMFNAICHKNKNFEPDARKGDAFSLGLTVLEAGSAHSVQDVYDRKDGHVNQQKLNNHLEAFRHRYGQQNSLLCDMVEQLCCVDPHRRMSCCELLEHVPKYDQIQGHFRSQGSHVEEVVEKPVYVSHPPQQSSYRQSNVVVQQEPVYRQESTYVSQAPVEVRRESNYVSQAPVYRSEVVQQAPQQVVRQEPQVVRQEPQVVRQEPQVIRSQAPVEVRREVVQQAPQVVRSEAPVEVRREPMVTRVEAPVQSYTTNNVIRSSNVVTQQAPVVRTSYRNENYVAAPVRTSYRTETTNYVSQAPVVVTQAPVVVTQAAPVRTSYREQRRSYRNDAQNHVSQPQVITREPIVRTVNEQAVRTSHVVNQGYSTGVQQGGYTTGAQQGGYTTGAQQGVTRVVSQGTTGGYTTGGYTTGGYTTGTAGGYTTGTTVGNVRTSNVVSTGNVVRTTGSTNEVVRRSSNANEVIRTSNQQC